MNTCIYLYNSAIKDKNIFLNFTPFIKGNVRNEAVS
jgi:hypothetical protein